MRKEATVAAAAKELKGKMAQAKLDKELALEKAKEEKDAIENERKADKAREDAKKDAEANDKKAAGDGGDAATKKAQLAAAATEEKAKGEAAKAEAKAAQKALRDGLLRYDRGRGWSGPMREKPFEGDGWRSALLNENIDLDYEDWRAAIVISKTAGSAALYLPRTATRELRSGRRARRTRKKCEGEEAREVGRQGFEKASAVKMFGADGVDRGA